MEIQSYLKKCQARINTVLTKKILPASSKQPSHLHRAMRYAVLNGGKRLRSALIYATGESLGVHTATLDYLCAAIELIHAFSLIHDDLPALDNDDLRRGKPSCHIAFGEATAILAGDALQSLAFEQLAKIDGKKILPDNKIQMVNVLARAIGSLGMIGGEELDIKMVNKNITLEKLKRCYKLKTGCLLSACVLLVALAANCRKKTLLNLEKFGYSLGIAFQIHDDLIGIKSDTKTLGKQQDADAMRHKPTYPSLIGLKKAEKEEAVVFRKALVYLKKAGIKSAKLVALASYIIERNN